MSTMIYIHYGAFFHPNLTNGTLKELQEDLLIGRHGFTSHTIFVEKYNMIIKNRINLAKTTYTQEIVIIK